MNLFTREMSKGADGMSEQTPQEAIKQLQQLLWMEWNYPNGVITATIRPSDQVFHVTIQQWEEFRQAVCILIEAYETISSKEVRRP